MGGSEGARDEGGEMHLASPFSPRESRGGEGQLKEKVPTHLHLPEKKKIRSVGGQRQTINLATLAALT